MKNFYTTIILEVMAIGLCAQITITNAVFPTAGDTLKTFVDISPQGIDLKFPGGPQTWDFTGLAPDVSRTVIYHDASAGDAFASFPDAELVTIDPGGDETYFDISATNFSKLGIDGLNPFGLMPFQNTFRFVPALYQSYAPIAFFDIKASTSNAIIRWSVSELPPEFVTGVGFPGAWDSIRMRVNISAIEVTDAYGSLLIPGSIYDILRQKRTTYRQIAVDVHIINPFPLGWIPFNQLGSSFNVGEAIDTFVIYRFLSASSKEPIAVVALDPGQSIIQSVEYKDNSAPSAVTDVGGTSALVFVSPNPAADEITIEMRNGVVGKFSFRLFDVNGHVIITTELSSDRETIRLVSVPVGLYVYQIVDDQNRLVRSGKLIKE